MQAPPMPDVDIWELSRDFLHFASGHHGSNSSVESAVTVSRHNAQGKYHIPLFTAILLIVRIAPFSALKMSSRQKFLKRAQSLLIFKMKVALQMGGTLLALFPSNDGIVEFVRPESTDEFDLAVCRIVKGETPTATARALLGRHGSRASVILRRPRRRITAPFSPP
ncbi:putative 18.3 kDa protein [Beak and feather disease virus]|uniref:Putative 18.3 kDa protein n=1 Tax=Beak and feather disease virus TaxID=77856 RepID=C7EYW7_BFDV|nr:putative 18.3 kDa protein [Beak and feather disease virus]ACY30722.1 putative 18.3 kDa protein [Beak and feather disease virus]